MEFLKASRTPTTRLKALASLLFTLIFLMPFSAHAVLLQTEPILANPASTENFWQYSYKANYSGVGNAYSYATTASNYTDAAFQGYVEGLHNTTDYNTLNSRGAADYRTVHVLSTYIMSTTNQTVDFRLGGDDGHSLFLNGNLLAGAGYGTSLITSADLLANTIYKLDFVGYNYTMAWGWAFGLWDTPNSQWVGAIQTGTNILMDAEGDFEPVPEPATMFLFGTGLLGLAGLGRKKHKR